MFDRVLNTSLSTVYCSDSEVELIFFYDTLTRIDSFDGLSSGRLEHKA